MTENKIPFDISLLTESNVPDIPMSLHTCRISDFPESEAFLNWNDKLELIRVISGSMKVSVNDNDLVLHENNILFVRSRQLHRLYQDNGKDCSFFLILMDPSIFGSAFGRNWTSIENDSAARNYCFMDDSMAMCKEVCSLADRIRFLESARPRAWRFEVIGILYVIIAKLYMEYGSDTYIGNRQENEDITIQKEMIAFIHAHYHEKISLNDIAASGKVCRSKCCRIFRRYIQKSPVEYLNEYRLQISQHFLLNHSLSIAEVSTFCGFNHQSYFTKLFVKRYGCTPYEFRKGKVRTEEET